MEPFEGTEKKCEVFVFGACVPLRSLPRDYWEELVRCCGAEILSSISNEDCDAHLLSESSLFVWDDRFLLITCGLTTMVDSLLHFLGTYDPACISQLLFQRKNEFHSELQFSSFAQDVERISTVFSGSSMIFGGLDSHHTQLFHVDRHRTSATLRSYELILYGINSESTRVLTEKGQSVEKIRQWLGLRRWLPGFELDDHMFQPYGYSLNAIRGADFITIHITPQPGESYVSIESNLDLATVIDIPLGIFQPESFDIVVCNPVGREALKEPVPEGYMVVQDHSRQLPCGWLISFLHFQSVD